VEVSPLEQAQPTDSTPTPSWRRIALLALVALALVIVIGAIITLMQTA